VSDGLSRLGALHPLTCDRGWQLQEFTFPSGLERECLIRLFETQGEYLDSGCTLRVR